MILGLGEYLVLQQLLLLDLFLDLPLEIFNLLAMFFLDLCHSVFVSFMTSFPLFINPDVDFLNSSL